MVLLSVALCTRTGRVLLSRQFVETSRMRIEGLLVAFPKLVSDAASSGKQHTFVETDSVRYVYTPLESMYLILITNKSSNIIEDLDTLRLLTKVVPEQLNGAPLTEESAAASAFELLFAFDEVVASGGYREDITLQQIRTNLEMESHEEKLAQMIKASRMAAAKDEAKKKAAMFREKAKEEEKLGRTSGLSGGRMGGVSSGSSNQPFDDPYARTGASSGSYTSPTTGFSGDNSYSTPTAAAAESSTRKAAGGGGLKLGGKKTAGGAAVSSSLAGVMAEEGIRDRDMVLSSGPSNSAAAAAAQASANAAAAVADHAIIAVEEKISVKLTRDGTCEVMEVKGTLTLTAQDEAHARLKIRLDKGPSASNFQFQTHPQLNKTAFTSGNIIELKQPEKPFPVGTPLAVLRWSRKLKDADIAEVPLSITCWPETAANGAMNVNLEYSLQDPSITLHDVRVIVPLGGDTVPKVTSCAGDWKHNTREHYIAWHIDSISEENASGTMEFTVKGRSEDVFFPVNVQFTSVDTLCAIAIGDVVTIDEGKPLRCATSKTLSTDNYVVE